jgi:thiaminase/transcriptional activator TenA
MPDSPPFLARIEQGLFGRLRRDAGAEWAAYTQHEFVRALARGTLPEADFRIFLTQDYLYLIHYARCYALAVFKSDTLEEMRAAARVMGHVLAEMPLHVEFCAEWGLTEADMQAQPESLELLAYSRFLVDRGVAGDVLDLLVSLSACAVGYGEVGARLLADPETVLEGNPYLRWMQAYASDEYTEGAIDAMAALERVWAARGSQARYPALLRDFKTAAQLEAAFWRAGQQRNFPA